MNTRRLAIMVAVLGILLVLPAGWSLAHTPMLDSGETATGVLEVRDVYGVNGDIISVPVYIQVGDAGVSGYGFDLYFDVSALQYQEGDFEMGDLDENWPVHDDTLIAPGHIRFGALDWNSMIPAGANGVLVTFHFSVRCRYCAPGDRFPLDLDNLDGDIRGYKDVDAYFIYERPVTPTPTPTPVPTPTPSGPPLTTAFTYQGRLTEAGRPANGAYDFRFTLYSAAKGGHQVGGAVIQRNVKVSQGVFTASLDFGDVFPGKRRWLEIAVRPAGRGDYTVLRPRQELTAAPYALALPGLRALPNDTSPNVVGGYEGNSVANGVAGATISGGGMALSPNQVTADLGAVGGGGGNVVGGKGATIPGGYGNEAKGAYSFAAGRRAKANADGCFVWGDGVSDMICNTPRRTLFSASGGFVIYTNPHYHVGVYLAPGSGSWRAFSDRAMKENIQPVDPTEVLDKLAQMPVSAWNYKSQDPSIRHMGPMAQDFYAAFGLGEDDRYISSIDAEGVALAAIQGLYQQNQEQARRIAELEARNEELQAQLQAIMARLEALEAQEGGGER